MKKRTEGVDPTTGFIPKLKQIWEATLVGHNVSRIEVAPFEEDYYHATDMLAYTSNGFLRLANRIRSFKHYKKHRGDFTLRSAGDPTEIYKIVYQGYGDYYLYAFKNSEGTDLFAWVVLDLEVFRREYKHALDVKRNGLNERRIIWDKVTWKGNTFRAFKLETFVPEIVVASHNHDRLPKGGITL
jgi:hypothetical protein